jgi:ABC-type multidrug transport system fused ATPase/permease subunit
MFRQTLKSSQILRALKILSRDDQRKLCLISMVQVFLGILDLLGVVMVGLLGAVSVTGLQANNPGDRVSTALAFLRLSEATFQTQAFTIATAAVILLVGRTLLSIYVTRKILFFLSGRGAKISADLVSRLLSQPLLAIQKRTSQETVYVITSGVTLIMLQILATITVMVADVSLLLIMTIGLLLVDPMTAVGTLLIFGLIGYLLYHLMHVRAGLLGTKSTSLTILSNEKIVEVFASYRESVVRNRRGFYSRQIGEIRFSLADVNAESAFMPYVSKYVIETAIVLGAISIGAVQFLLEDASHAAATLAVFLAAGSRIAPAVLRIQQSSIQVRYAIGQVSPTLDLIDSLGSAEIRDKDDDLINYSHLGFQAEIEVSSATLTYPGKITPAINDLSLKIDVGTSVAFVGPSGAGKTTVVDVILGVLQPDQGSVLISGLPPLEAIAKWPGAVSYVPQDVVIVNGTIRENISLGFPSEEVEDERIFDALRIANLSDFVQSLPNGIDTQVGERGTNLSGGQRQRLGIARAMLTCPKLLILDEATSSLDGETEESVTKAIQSLHGSTTVVMIAHRLSTIKNSDLVIYLSEGRVVAKGSFQEVRLRVPDFERQAALMGL